VDLLVEVAAAVEAALAAGFGEMAEATAGATGGEILAMTGSCRGKILSASVEEGEFEAVVVSTELVASSSAREKYELTARAATRVAAVAWDSAVLVTLCAAF